MLVASVYIMWVLLLVLALAVFALYRYFGQLYVNSAEGRAEQGPGVGSSLLSIARPDVNGNLLTLPSERPTLILFADTTCDICSYLRDNLSALSVYADRLEVVVFCSGQQRDIEAWATRVWAHARVVPDIKAKVAHHYAVNGTPYMIAVGQSGRVHGKGIVNSEEGLLFGAEQAFDLQLTADDVEKAEANQT